jgi:hypothetical protein
MYVSMLGSGVIPASFSLLMTSFMISVLYKKFRALGLILERMGNLYFHVNQGPYDLLAFASIRILLVTCAAAPNKERET